MNPKDAPMIHEVLLASTPARVLSAPPRTTSASTFLVALVAFALLLAACTTPEGGGPAGSANRKPEPEANGGGEARPPEPDLPVAENTRERNERLRRLEQACDQWHSAYYHQEYARMESMASLLRTYTQEHFDEIVSDLQHASPRHRKTMAAALGFSGRSAAVPPLVSALKDQYYEVVLHSLFAIYQLAETAAKPVEKTATEEPSIVVDPEVVVPYLQHPRAEVRSNAALALTRLVGPATSKSVLLALIGTAEDQDAATRVHAVAALGAFRDREAFPHLVKALGDPVQLVRIRAALGLGRLGDPNAIPYLIEMLTVKDEKTDVKAAVGKVLAVLTGERSATSTEPEFWRDVAAKKNLPH